MAFNATSIAMNSLKRRGEWGAVMQVQSTPAVASLFWEKNAHPGGALTTPPVVALADWLAAVSHCRSMLCDVPRYFGR